MVFPENPMSTAAAGLVSKADGKVNAALDFLFTNGKSSSAQLKRAMGINCNPDCYLGKQIISGQIKRSGNYWWLPAAESAPAAAAPAEINAPAVLEPAIGAQEPGVTAQMGKADTPETSQLEAAQDTPPESLPVASEKVENPETLPAVGSGQTGIWNVPVEIETAERIPQEAEPLDTPAPIEDLEAKFESWLAKSRTFLKDHPIPPKRHFRCCRWSDQSVTLQRGDELFELNSFEASVLLQQLGGVPA